jgi:hypothetical protein
MDTPTAVSAQNLEISSLTLQDLPHEVHSRPLASGVGRNVHGDENDEHLETWVDDEAP